MTFVVGLAATRVQGQCSPAQIAKLTASDAAVDDGFGDSIAISNETMIIGSRNDENGGLSTGSAYVFVRSGAQWTQQGKLLALDGASGDLFGLAVTVDGNTAVVGAFGDDSPGVINGGAAYVFVRSGTTWTQQAKLVAADAATAACFGRSVALLGDTLLVGAFGASHAGGSLAGSVYYFVRVGTVWTQQGKISATDAAAGDNFGLAVARSGNTAIISAHRDDHVGQTDAGSAYVFVRSGNTWSQQAKLIANDASMDDLFGTSLALSGDVALIGSYNDSNEGGANAGSAYVFRRSGTTWTQESKFVASDAAASDGFGISVAISGEIALIGAFQDDHAGGVDAGSAYVYQRSAGTWNERAKLTAGDSAGMDQFGWFVLLNGNLAGVSAFGDDLVGAADAGSAYVFDLGCPISCCTGDFDENGLVTNADIGGFVTSALVSTACAGPPQCCPGDLNDDGTVNGADVSGFVVKLLSGGACQ